VVVLDTFSQPGRCVNPKKQQYNAQIKISVYVKWIQEIRIQSITLVAPNVQRTFSESDPRKLRSLNVR